MPEPNDVLRGVRESLNLGQGEFAAAINRAGEAAGDELRCDIRLVAKWEAGEVQWPQGRYRRALEAVTGMPCTALGFRPHPPRSTRRGTSSPTSSPSPAGAFTVDSTRDLEDPVQRREFLAGALAMAAPEPRQDALDAVGALGSVLGEAAAEALEFTRRAGASELGSGVLEHLELVIHRFSGSYAATRPADVWPQVRWYRRRVAELIDGRHTLREGRELYAQAGWLSVILAWLAHDLGDPRAAEAYALDAWEHAWQAEHLELCAWAMDVRATVALYDGRPEDALDAAARGARYAPRGTAAQVRLLGQVARAHARLGRREEFEDARRRAEHTLDQLPGHGFPLFSADAVRLSSYAASAYLWLDRPRDALRHAEEAIAVYEQAPRRSATREAIARLDLSLALARLGAPDGAAQTGLAALMSPRLVDAVRVRAGELDAVLRGRHHGLPEVRDFHERYVALVKRAALRPGSEPEDQWARPSR
ncbi:hypothetical protein C3Y87_03230 [Carbonactinospora thermoautotrophica]|uniref:hypothetical protein n=1 Tax=Carbonactinospora thermoautotrophica TaxID=1469144 RepID=UPI002271E436|nr:hypothetical protein [Carbonactinospora thermoautotrophica]MCX9190444.1 hypothetical protein [Carbonactinospora thermoautotrophica]